MAHVHFSIAFPIYAGLALAVGSSLVFVVDGNGNIVLLFSGVALAICAIFCLAAAEMAETVGGEVVGGLDVAVCDTDVKAGFLTLSPLQLQDDGEKSEAVTAAAALSTHKSRGWVNVCVFCGLLGGLWSPLSTLGRLEGGVEAPLTGLVIFQLGQLCCVPLQCCYYSLVLLLLQGREAYSQSNDPVIFLGEIAKSCRESARDTILALCTGAIVGTGYTLYFLASAVVNPTVALAIPSCEPLVAIVFGVVVSRKLQYATNTVRVYYLLAFSLFIAAIALLAKSI